MQRQHRLAAQLASAPLIRLRRIGKAITKYDFAFRKRRLNHFRDVLRSGTKHERQLSRWSKRGSLRIQQELANFFSRRRSARLPCHHNGQSLPGQRRSQFGQLRTFAASVEPFKSNESTARSVGGHGKHHSKAAWSCDPSTRVWTQDIRQVTALTLDCYSHWFFGCLVNLSGLKELH